MAENFSSGWAFNLRFWINLGVLLNKFVFESIILKPSENSCLFGIIHINRNNTKRNCRR
jgi:hypothetical protein